MVLIASSLNELTVKLLLVEAEDELRHFQVSQARRVVGNGVLLLASSIWKRGKPYRSTRECSEVADRSGRGGGVSGLRQGLCDGLIGGILLHLWDHDAPMELF